MATNYKGDEIPAEYKGDELLWRLCEFDPKENSDYWADKADTERICERMGVPSQPLTEKLVSEFADKFLKA